MQAFAVLSDPTRAGIVDVLADGERTVNEIVSAFDLSQPSISRHLRVLREAGLVSVHPDGQRFVVVKDIGTAAGNDRLHFVDNWFTELERLVPADGM